MNSNGYYLKEKVSGTFIMSTTILMMFRPICVGGDGTVDPVVTLVPGTGVADGARAARSPR